MSSSTLNVARRVILQVVRDRRTIALIIVAPLVIATVAGFSIPDKMMLDNAAPAILATLIIFFGFLITGISFLRERTQGTLERMLVSPISRMDIVAGYLLGLLLFALLQTLIMFFYMVYVLSINYQGDLWQILVFQMLIGIVAVCMGTFFSAFARNEFQMIQFIPLIIVPQIFLSGLFIQTSQLPYVLEWISKFLPLTYGVEGIKALMQQGQSLLDIGKDIGILAAFAAGFLVLASLTLRQKS
ncbi:MAG: ABC transporter permease [Chloroflexi bacterium RBG_13_51_18]|nr:MAG: ABC transporter permease [Chloroflexi bacterium RBG_13_51_18]